MNENQTIRKRTHRIKTMNSQSNHPSLLISLQGKLNSTMFRQQISKVQAMISRQSRQNKQIPTNRRTSFARRTVNLSQKLDSSTKSLNFYIMDHCNNGELISRLLQERGRWVKSETRSGQVSLIWGYLNKSQISRLRGNQVLSRFPISSQMTDKGNLYDNLAKYCEKRAISMNFLPITFHLNREGPIYSLRENIKEFIEFFNYVKDNTNLSNTWIMKPTNMNQGRDIHLFNSLQSFLQLLEIERTQRKIELIEKDIQQQIRKTRSFILQKYIQNPLLLDGHKFDVRMWVLLDHQGQYYIFQEGYLRFTSVPYRLDNYTIKNNFVHLTNHALQKYSPNYSKSHNLRPMSTLKTYLLQQKNENGYNKILQQMKRIVDLTIKATIGVWSHMATKQQCFQIYGFDFLLDRQMNVRLIEANCNPAITEDCDLLAELIPKMINDAFKLTIDKIYGTKNSKNYHINRLANENSWIKLGELNKP